MGIGGSKGYRLVNEDLRFLQCSIAEAALVAGQQIPHLSSVEEIDTNKGSTRCLSLAISANA
jgi:hypothetical protein